MLPVLGYCEHKKKVLTPSWSSDGIKRCFSSKRSSFVRCSLPRMHSGNSEHWRLGVRKRDRFKIEIVDALLNFKLDVSKDRQLEKM